MQGAVKGFESFVSWLESGPDALQSDRHWMPQFLLLRPDILGYDYIGKMENRDEIDQRLSSAVGEEHGGPFGKERVLNKSLLSYHPDLVTEKAKESIRILYADDFKTFGYDDTVLPARGLPLEKSAVEKTLLRVFIKRAQSAQRKLVTLEAEREALETNPLVALKQLGKACLCPLRYSWSRLRHRV